MLKHKFIQPVFILLALVCIIVFRNSRLLGIYLPLVALAYVTFSAVGSYFIQVNYYTDAFNHGPRNQKKIALTFDDGPQLLFTEQVLDILKEKNVQATFFLIGSNIKEREDTVLRMLHEGHAIGNHSFSHNYWFSLKSTATMLADIKLCDAEIERVCGRRPRLFRPPYGVTNPMVAGCVKRGNYTTVGWSLRSYDTTASNAGALLNKITARVKAGDIILLHEWGKHTIEILPELIDECRKKGFEFAGIEELLGVNAWC